MRSVATPMSNNVRPVSNNRFSNDAGQGWEIDGSMIATTRNTWSGNRTPYTVTHFRPGA